MAAILPEPALTPELATRLVNIALGHVVREYPFALGHVTDGPGDLAAPSTLHPVFHGSFDWHSCVHGHWLLARILRRHPQLPECAAIRRHFDGAFTPEKVAGEIAYLRRPASAGFERPYGWAWLLKLAAEFRAGDGEADTCWATALQPLATTIVARFLGFLPKADYPVRAGVHANTAFALALSWDYANRAPDAALAELIEHKAESWYGADRDCQAWEPCGDEFLSPALMEAELMRRILVPDAFRAWFARFLPRAAEGQPETLFSPARISDRSDGKIAHLDGLNLSRAWCWRGIAAAFDEGSSLRARADRAVRDHLAASLPHLADAYAGEHWLASFALLALEPIPET
jgi:hypothetical protein